MNGYCAKLASNFDAKIGLLTLSDPRQHKKCAFFNFHNFEFTAPLSKMEKRAIMLVREAKHSYSEIEKKLVTPILQLIEY